MRILISNDDGVFPGADEKPIEVGSVSPEVLDELSRLFGGEPESVDVTVVEVGDGSGETVTTFVEVVEIVDESVGATGMPGFTLRISAIGCSTANRASKYEASGPCRYSICPIHFRLNDR